MMMKAKETRLERMFREQREEREARMYERAAEMRRQEAAFQKELMERADGKGRALWRRPWEC